MYKRLSASFGHAFHLLNYYRHEQSHVCLDNVLYTAIKYEILLLLSSCVAGCASQSTLPRYLAFILLPKSGRVITIVSQIGHYMKVKGIKDNECDHKRAESDEV